MKERDTVFKIGTKVKLHNYLKVGNYYGGMKFEDFCKQDFGKVLTITKVTPCNGYISTTKYEFEETPLEYTVEMLEPVPKYKVGDKVTIRKNLKVYGCESVVSAMMAHRGQQATIKNVIPNSYKTLYKTNCTNYHWTEDMFEDSTTGTVETTADCDFKVGDKVIMNPERSSRLGVFTITNIYDGYHNTSFYMLSDNKDKPADSWLAESIIKVPLFKVGQIVQFKNIKEDKWYPDTIEMAEIENELGVVAEVKENHYTADKPYQDGCLYAVKALPKGETWHVTSASLRPVVSTLEDVKSVSQDDPGPIRVRDDGALAIAQTVDNVKGPQFKIGDRVLIREDLIPGKSYIEWGGWCFLSDMAQHMGKVAKVIDYGFDDTKYLRLDVDNGEKSWIVNSVLPYTPGSDYDLDKQIINQQKTIKQNENRLQEKGPVIAGRERQSGCAVRYPGEQIRVSISNLGYRKVTCKR